MTSFLANHAAMFLGPWACGSECCSSNSNAPDTSQKGLIGIQSHHSREKMSKKAREKPAEAGSASMSPYGSVLSYELVTSQPNRLINLTWPECRTWFIGPWTATDASGRKQPRTQQANHRRVRTIFRPAIFRLLFFRKQIFVPHFFVTHFFRFAFISCRIFSYRNIYFVPFSSNIFLSRIFYYFSFTHFLSSI